MELRTTYPTQRIYSFLCSRFPGATFTLDWARTHKLVLTFRPPTLLLLSYPILSLRSSDLTTNTFLMTLPSTPRTIHSRHFITNPCYCHHVPHGPLCTHLPQRSANCCSASEGDATPCRLREAAPEPSNHTCILATSSLDGEAPQMKRRRRREVSSVISR